MPSPKPADTQASALAVEVRVAVGQLIRKLREQAPHGDLTGSQLLVLGRLEREGPATVTALARATGVRPQSMGATVAALEAMGHVAGAPDPTDGRQTILSLTPSARAWFKAGRAVREDWLFKAIRARLGPDEQDHLATAVQLLRRLVEP
jgi:DNA-binding MarR family transcriptional regulator